MTKNNENRIEYVDIYRGIGIVLMIMGHIWFGSYFDKFIHAFHMPMFFFISSFFYRKNDLATMLNKRTKTLLIPYIVWGVFNILILSAIDGVFYKTALLHLLWINTDGLMNVGAMWFLTAMFFSNIIYSIIDHLIKNRTSLNAVVIILSLIGNLFAGFSPIRLPWALDAALVAIGFMHIGRLVVEHKNQTIIKKIMQLKWHEFLATCLFTLVLIFVNGYINLRTGEYSCIPLFWINALLAIIVLINFSKYYCNASANSVVINYSKNIMSYIGKNSITFLCLNQITIKFFTLIFDFMPILVYKVLVLLMTITTLCLVNYFINLTRFRILLGKQ